MTAAFVVCFAGLHSLALLLPRPAAAAWPADPLVNVPLCTAAFDQLWPAAVPDGAGGSIVVWSDLRAGGTYAYSDLYAQRVSAGGAPQWAGDGVAVCTAVRQQLQATVASDGVGGVIATWSDNRDTVGYHIYAQRISGAGVVQWTTDGVAVCTAANFQQSPTIISDGTGGAIIAWFDSRDGGYDIYAQRISATGTPQWTANGVAICTAAGFQEYPTLVSDGTGGAIVTWFDQRTGGNYTFSDIYAQRISGAGITQWTADGVALCTAAGADQDPKLVADGLGGAIVTWFDYRSGDYDIYAQQVSGAGITQWTGDGVAICIQPGEQAAPAIIPDGAGGAIISWRDSRSGTSYDNYAQRISAFGVPQWATDGVALCTAAGDQYEPALVPDGAGGAIASWTDLRNFDGDIYAQRISAGGTPQWTAQGVALCTAAGLQNVPAIVSDGANGGIVAWHDKRSGTSNDIYAQRVKGSGLLGGDVTSVPAAPSLTFALDPVRPNPARGSAMMVHFALPSGAAASLELLDVAGRRIASHDVGALGAGSHALDLAEGRHLAPGLYLVSLRQGANVRSARVAVLE